MRFLPLLFLLAGTIHAATPERGALNQLPAWFEPAPAGPGFVLRNSEALLQARPSGVHWISGNTLLALEVAGSASEWKWRAEGTLAGSSNYLIGRDQTRWRMDVPRHGRLVAPSILPGTDFHIYASGAGLEYDFVLAPGADPSAIALRFRGAGRLRIDARGDLLVPAGGTVIRQHAPVAWQELAGGRKAQVKARWALRNGVASFEIAKYDPSRILVIDPVVSYSGYFGGSLIDRINAVAPAGDGGFWLTGTIRSTVSAIEGTNPFQPEKKGDADAFLAKVTPQDGAWQISYFTYLGGDGEDSAEAIVVKDGFVYIAGQTNSNNWPLAGEAFQTQLEGNFDAFVMKYDPRSPGLEAIFYSSYFGGKENEFVTSVAVDGQDRIAVAGYTISESLKGVAVGTDLQPSNRGGVDGFYFQCVTNAPTSQALLSGSFFGGNSTDIVSAAVFDPAGFLYLTGVSHSTDLPLNGPGYQSEQQGGGDIFVAKVDAKKRGFDAFLLGTYVGGSSLDVATSMKLDPQGLLWIGGYTLSRNLPLAPGAHQADNAGRADGFVAGLNPAAGGAEFLRYLSYFGGSQDDVIYGIELGADGRKTVAGYTYSRDFPLKDNPTPPAAGLRQGDVFISQFDTARAGADALVYSVVFGGPGQDAAFDLALAPNGTPFAAGTSSSPNLQTEGTPAKPNGTGYSTGLFLQLGPARQ